MKTIGFLLSGLGVSGGVHVVLRWAQALTRRGYLVYVAVPQAERRRPVPFLDAEEVTFPILSYDDAREIRFDVLFATWWETLILLSEFEAGTYALFAQALESQFYRPGDREQDDCNRLLGAGIPVVTIAHWLRDQFTRRLGVPQPLVRTVLNPLDKAHFRPTKPKYAKRSGVRFLVEGPSTDERKNVATAIELLERAGVPYLWVGALVDKRLTGRHCIDVLEAVPYREMPALYASADVLVKLSNGEGMFGPPLEMFATGGTALAWDVWGAEEYMSHLHNCWLAPMNSAGDVAAAIELLRKSGVLVERLQRNALATAAAWPDWSEAEQSIVRAVEELPHAPPDRLFREAARIFSRRQRGARGGA